MSTRLIERWLPIAALSEECVRERRSMTALPPIYYLHVWRARRPLVASRVAILASLLPADADHEKFMHVTGETRSSMFARLPLFDGTDLDGGYSGGGNARRGGPRSP